MPSAAEYVEQIDAQVYRMVYPSPGPGGPSGPGGASSAPGAPGTPTSQPEAEWEPGEPPIEWEASLPSGEYRCPSQVARGVFHWLLPGQLPPDGEESLDPDQATAHLHGAMPTEPELLAIWGFARAIALCDRAARLRVDRLRPALGVSEGFDTQVAGVLQEAVGDPGVGGDPVRLVTDPPRPVFDAIARSIARSTPRTPRPLPGLAAVAYQHPEDRAVQSQLMAVPVLGPLVTKFTNLFTRSGELSLLGQAVEVTSTSLPITHRAYRQACDTLGVTRPPRLFVSPQGFSPGGGGVISCQASGVDEPYILLGMVAANVLDPIEQTFLLGRELGHVQADHVKYRTLARWLQKGANAARAITFGLSDLLSNATIRPLLAAWYRRTAYTADRAGLLACQNREVALRVLMKQTGYPMRYYHEMKTRAMIEQALRHRAEVGSSLVSTAITLTQQYDLANPWVVDRAAELLDWLDDGGYAEMVQATECQRQAMAARIAADPGLQRLFDVALRAVIDWAAERFKARRVAVGPVVRRMVYDRVPPVGTPVEPIARIELVAEKKSASEIDYLAAVLFMGDTGPRQATITLPFDPSWDRAPAEIRDDFIRRGEQKVIRLMYPTTAR